MTLRERIAEIISSTSRVEDCADAILADPEIAALVRVGDFCLDTMFVPSDGGDAFRCAFCGCGERPVQFRPKFVHARNCALARLEEVRK